MKRAVKSVKFSYGKRALHFVTQIALLHVTLLSVSSIFLTVPLLGKENTMGMRTSDHNHVQTPGENRIKDLQEKLERCNEARKKILRTHDIVINGQSHLETMQKQHEQLLKLKRETRMRKGTTVASIADYEKRQCDIMCLLNAAKNRNFYQQLKKELEEIDQLLLEFKTVYRNQIGAPERIMTQRANELYAQLPPHILAEFDQLKKERRVLEAELSNLLSPTIKNQARPQTIFDLYF